MTDVQSGTTWLVWDGDCGFCARSVAWVVRKDSKKVFTPATYQSRPPVPEPVLAGGSRRAYVVRPDGTVYGGGRAVLYVLERLKWGWFARFLALPPMVWVAEAIYWLIARNRTLISRLLKVEGKACGIQDP